MSHPDADGRVADAQRRAWVAAVLAQPPQVHAVDGEQNPRLGVFETDRSCYDFLIDHVAPGCRSLETGLGVSTALFAALGADHCCVVNLETQVVRLRAYCAEMQLPLDRVRFEVGCSDDVLPRLAVQPLDLLFIDGGHGFPIPAIDWHFGSKGLVRGGLLVLDDVTLPAVWSLRKVLDADPHWKRRVLNKKWAAYERLSTPDAVEDWWEQPWLPIPRVIRAQRLAARGLRGLRRRFG